MCSSKYAASSPGWRARLVHPRQVAADVPHPLGQRYALGVHRRQVLRLQHSGHGPAADEPAVKAGALFVCEHDGLDGMTGDVPVLRHRLHHLDGPHHAQRAVVLPAQGHSVGVRAEGDGGQGVVGPSLPPDDVAAGVYAHLQPGLPHQSHGVLAALDVRGREGQTVHPFRRLPELPQLVQGAIQARCVNGDTGHDGDSPLTFTSIPFGCGQWYFRLTRHPAASGFLPDRPPVFPGRLPYSSG